MPSKEKSRSQRITEEDQELLLKALSWDGSTTPETSRHYVAWAFRFALETAMRQGEILAMRRKDIKEGFVHLPMTKMVNPETCLYLVKPKDCFLYYLKEQINFCPLINRYVVLHG